jgi:iron complex outermembrane receptor protein
LHDVESIEFIRGPQGTLYGASGPGGVINITSRQPGNIWRGNAGFSYGSYNQQAYDVAISGPIITEQLALGVSGLYSMRDGFVKNLADGQRLDDQKTLAGRVQLRWTPSEPWEFSLLASGQRFDDDFVPTFNPASDRDFFHVRRDYPGYVDTETWNLALKAAWRGEAVKVTSVTSYRDWQQDLAQDFDFTDGFDFLSPPSPANPFPTIGFFRPDLQQWTHEVRVRSLDPGDALKWNAGIFGNWTEVRTDSGRNVTIPFFGTDSSTTRARHEAETYALFGEATYSVQEKFDFIGGLRLTHDVRELRRGRAGFNLLDVSSPFGPFAKDSYQVEDDYDAILPKFGLAYHFQSECVLYATVSAGYQSGGFNASNDEAAQSGFDAARSWHYETGVRTLWLDQKLEINAALFFTDTDDYQVYRLSAQDPAQAWMLNADRALAWGAELELVARPFDQLTLSLLAGYTHAEFDRFRYMENSVEVSFDGKTINFVPEFTAILAAEYRFWKGLYARVELAGVGKYYLDEANSKAQNAYALLNARVGYARDNFEVFVFGRNLLDEEYASNALDFRPASGLILQPGDPLCVGVGISAKF